MGITTIIALAGGLGLFLYGMKLMSDGLEKVAGAKMRNVLDFITRNRLIGMLVGMFFTAVVQSSSATTVMVVSFVNSGLMTLLQAAGVIMGANIGTTITGQLIAFKLSDVAPFFVIVGVVMIMFCKKANIKKIGEVVLGFGILFMGLTYMSDSMATFKESPQIVSILGSLQNHYLAILVGFVITAILQSSSATVGIVIVMAGQGLLALPICFFITLGCNMGSCVSALLASLGGKKDAKRAAWIHFLFNIVGSTIIMLILTFALDPITNAITQLSGGDMSRSVANAHTIFKIVEVIIIFPFVQWIVKLTYLIVPGDDKQGEGFELVYIGEKSVFSPATAVVEVTRELERMGDMAINNLTRAMNALITLDEEEIKAVYEMEKNIDFLNEKITDYLVNINQMTLPVDDAKNIGGLFHVVNDIERIGDHAENVADDARDRIENKISFSQEAQEELSEMLDMVIKITTYAIDMFSNNNREHMNEILALENEIDHRERALQQSHVERLTRNECTPGAGMMYSDIVSGLERVADHATNIAFSLMEEDPDEKEKELAANA
ncbi:MAG: Na/Pi cotransporter family protein [Lachnospiraceae bacterium]|nr:Na/Pi cotransporter family protein [Lachnospiraceae bacterium]